MNYFNQEKKTEENVQPRKCGKVYIINASSDWGQWKASLTLKIWYIIITQFCSVVSFSNNRFWFQCLQFCRCGLLSQLQLLCAKKYDQLTAHSLSCTKKQTHFGEYSGVFIGQRDRLGGDQKQSKKHSEYWNYIHQVDRNTSINANVAMQLLKSHETASGC